jgi:YhcH/YjgK/YiaL family protein
MIIDNIKNAEFYSGISENICTALDFIKNNDLSKYENGRYEIDGDKIYVLVQDYQTKPISEGRLEAHRKYIDIQYIIRGCERMGYAALDGVQPSTEYDEVKDLIFYEGCGDFVTAKQGDFLVFAPQDAHMPGIMAEKSSYVKKAVFKIMA